MRYLPFFNDQVDPAQFRRGFGVSGFSVYLLNLLRLLLGRVILRWIARQEGVSLGRTETFIEKVQESVSPPPAVPSHVYLRPGQVLSREAPTVSVLPAPEAPAAVRAPSSRESRYRGRRRVVVAEVDDGG